MNSSKKNISTKFAEELVNQAKEPIENTLRQECIEILKNLGKAEELPTTPQEQPYERNTD